MVYAVWSGVGVAFIFSLELFWQQREQWNGKDIGPIGTLARIEMGLGPIASPLSRWPRTGDGFAAIRLFSTTPARLRFARSVAPPHALYLTWWYAHAFSVRSSAALLFGGLSMVLAALCGYARCDMLALSNWLLRRCDQIACAVFTPIDNLEHYKPR